MQYLLGLGFIYLLLPSTLPVNFDGVPLDKRHELIALLVFGSFAGKAILGWAFEISKRNRAISGRLGVGIALIMVAIVSKLLLSPTETISTCVSIVGVSPTPESCINRTMKNISEVRFGPDAGFPMMPLGGINNLSFNHHYCNAQRDAVCRGLQSTRMKLGYPFTIRFDVPAGYFSDGANQRLSLTYRGKAEVISEGKVYLLPFQQTTQTLDVPISPASQFSIIFKNYQCGDIKNCEVSWGFASIIPFKSAQISVNNRRMIIRHGFDRLVLIPEILAMVGLLIGLCPAFSWWKVLTDKIYTYKVDVQKVGIESAFIVGTLLSYLCFEKFSISKAKVGFAFAGAVGWVIAPVFSAGGDASYHELLGRMLRRYCGAAIGLGFFLIVANVPPFDFLIPLPTGDDRLTYSSWSRDVNANGTLTEDPSIVLSKPFFLLIFSCLNRIFGDLNGYNIAVQQWLGLSALLLSLIVFSTQCFSQGTNKARISSWLGPSVLAILVGWLSNSVVSAVVSSTYMSEMILWMVGLPTISLYCLSMSSFAAKNPPARASERVHWLLAVGSASMVATRTQCIIIIWVVGLVAILLVGRRAFGIVLRSLLGTVIMLTVVLVRFATTSTSIESVRSYVRANTVKSETLWAGFVTGWTDTIFDPALNWALITLLAASAGIARKMRQPRILLVCPLVLLTLYVAQNPMKVTGVRQLFLNGWTTAFLSASFSLLLGLPGKTSAPVHSENKT